jgi:hypothetical protein
MALCLEWWILSEFLVSAAESEQIVGQNQETEKGREDRRREKGK